MRVEINLLQPPIKSDSVVGPHRRVKRDQAPGERSVGADDLARSQASGADLRSSDGVAVFNSYSLNVRVPFPSGMSHGMRYIISGGLTFSADLTLSCHLPHLLFQNVNPHKSGKNSYFRRSAADREHYYITASRNVTSVFPRER